MPYNYITLAQARSQLASRLYDATEQFWTSAEKTLYIQEAIRAWNAHTSFFRTDFTFPTVASTTWYDLTSLPNTPRSYNVTDNSILQLMEYMLLEPLTAAYPLIWGGSLQFAIADILNAIQRRRDEVISITGCTLTQRTLQALLQTRIFLPDTVIDIRRIGWIPVTSQTFYTPNPVWPSDEYSKHEFDPTYTTDVPGNPLSYRQSSEPVLSFDVGIIPAVNGTYDVLTTEAGAALSTTQSTKLVIPDDFNWVIVFGALSDLLSRESNAKDILRAKYCEARYRQGLALLMNAPSILYVRLNNQPLDIDAVHNADLYRPGWQGLTPGQPDTMYTAGLNLFALAAQPNVVFGMTASVVQNAPIPVADSDSVQISRDDLETILDYSQHLATFKLGGDEFLSTLPLLERFTFRAKIYNSKLEEMGEFQDVQYTQSQLQQEIRPTMADRSIIS